MATLVDWIAVLVIWVSVGIIMPPGSCGRVLWDFLPVRSRASRAAAG